MSGEEIRIKISQNNKIIEEADKTMFTLNKKVLDAIEENKRLRTICHHEYNELGYCIFCDEVKE